MSDTFEGLEALDKIDENQEVEVNLGMEDMVDLIIDGMEVDEAVTALAAAEDNFEGIFDSLAAVEHLAGIIEEHGISQSLMAHADPNGYFAKNLGLTETAELDSTPIKDANATAAVEGFKETMKKWGEAISKFFKMLLDKVKALFGKVVQLFQKYEATLKKLKASLNGVKMDDKKAKEKKVNCLSAKDMGEFAKGLEALGKYIDGKALEAAVTKKNGKDILSAGNAIVKAVQKELAVVGRKVSGDAEGLKLESVEATYAKGKNDTVAAHGLSPKACETMVDVSLKLAVALRASAGTIKAMEAANKAVDAGVKSMEKADAAGAKEERAALEAQKKVATLGISVITATTVQIKKYIAYTIAATNAVLACKA